MPINARGMDKKAFWTVVCIYKCTRGSYFPLKVKQYSTPVSTWMGDRLVASSVSDYNSETVIDIHIKPKVGS